MKASDFVRRSQSFLTAFLFILGKTAIGFNLSKTNPGSAYGAAGVQNLPVPGPIISLEKFRQQMLL